MPYLSVVLIAFNSSMPSDVDCVWHRIRMLRIIMGCVGYGVEPVTRYILALHTFNWQVFAAITCLTGTIIGIFESRRAWHIWILICQICWRGRGIPLWTRLFSVIPVVVVRGIFCSTTTTPNRLQPLEWANLEELEASYWEVQLWLFSEIFVYQQQLSSKRLLTTTLNSSSFFFNGPADKPYFSVSSGLIRSLAILMDLHVVTKAHSQQQLSRVNAWEIFRVL